MKTTTQKIIMAAMFASLVCVVTMLIKVPSPFFKGYINLGDCIVLLCGWLLSPLYGFLAAGIGSALGDLLSGYVVYAPVTFVVKGLMAYTAHMLYKSMPQKKIGILSGGICAELIMIFGYYLFEGILYGFIPSAVNIPLNAVQGAAGLILGVILIGIFEKNRIKF